ncbi:MAG: hypothetical protein VX938_11160, partial [Myxococcota bacterium]|nr:hypothetical protein [Myxococcota bacterium]
MGNLPWQVEGRSQRIPSDEHNRNMWIENLLPRLQLGLGWKGLPWEKVDDLDGLEGPFEEHNLGKWFKDKRRSGKLYQILQPRPPADPPSLRPRLFWEALWSLQHRMNDQGDPISDTEWDRSVKEEWNVCVFFHDKSGCNKGAACPKAHFVEAEGRTLL